MYCRCVPRPVRDLRHHSGHSAVHIGVGHRTVRIARAGRRVQRVAAVPWTGLRHSSHVLGGCHVLHCDLRRVCLLLRRVLLVPKTRVGRMRLVGQREVLPKQDDAGAGVLRVCPSLSPLPSPLPPFSFLSFPFLCIRFVQYIELNVRCADA